MSTGKRYNNDYKVQAVKLAMEIGQTNAAKELGLSKRRQALGLAMDTNMRADLCIKTLNDAHNKHPELSGAIIYSDRGSQYTRKDYRAAMKRHGFSQSMNSDGGRCHDNARCESMWARMKEELLYGRYDTTKMTAAEVKSLIWRYYESYWNNRRICSAIGGMPSKVKLGRYYASLHAVAQKEFLVKNVSTIIDNFIGRYKVFLQLQCKIVNNHQENTFFTYNLRLLLLG